MPDKTKSMKERKPAREQASGCDTETLGAGFSLRPLRKGGLVKTGLLAIWRARLKSFGKKQGCPWLSAMLPALQRKPRDFDKLETIDPGVNFFVLALEHLGAKTFYSCEGHPNGFYVYFSASYALAKRIQAAGFFSVEIEPAGWAIRLNAQRNYTQRERDFTLRLAADAWMEELLTP